MAAYIQDQNTGEAASERVACSLGSKVSLTVVGGLVANLQWTIGSWGNTVRDFKMYDRSTHVQPVLVTSKPALTFYWSKPGTFTVTAQGKVGGSFWRKQIKYTVESPQVHSFRSTVSAVTVGLIKSPTTHNPTPALTFGGTDGKPGILIDAHVQSPSTSKCRFGVTQVMTIDRRFGYESGHTVRKTSNGVVVLDEDVLYGVAASLDDDPKDYITVNARALGRFVHEDSPASLLSRTQFRGETQNKVSIDERFTTYLMYRPKGGIWMAIAHTDWAWAGTATWTSWNGSPPQTPYPGYGPGGDKTGYWRLTGERWTRSPTVTVGVTFPTWNGNRNDIM